MLIEFNIVIIYAIERKYYKLSLLLFILIIYSIYVPYRTLIVIVFFSYAYNVKI